MSTPPQIGALPELRRRLQALVARPGRVVLGITGATRDAADIVVDVNRI